MANSRLGCDVEASDNLNGRSARILLLIVGLRVA